MTILIIFILLLLIALIPIRCIARVNTDGARIEIKYLFFRFTLFPTDKKKNGKTQQNEKEEKKEKAPKERDIKKQLKILYSIKADILSSLKKIIRYILKHAIEIESLNISAKIGTGDPADTGIVCGSLYSFIYPAIGTLSASARLKEHSVIIDPDFDNAKLEAGIYAAIRTRLAHLLVLLIMLINLVIKYLSAKKHFERSLVSENEKHS